MGIRGLRSGRVVEWPLGKGGLAVVGGHDG